MAQRKPTKQDIIIAKTAMAIRKWNLSACLGMGRLPDPNDPRPHCGYIPFCKLNSVMRIYLN